MRFLALILLGPWLAILAWAYCRYPHWRESRPARRWFDVVVVAIAVLVSVAMTHYGFASADASARPGHVAVWRMIAPVLYAYGGFSAVLALGLALRKLVWPGTRASTGS